MDMSYIVTDALLYHLVAKKRSLFTSTHTKHFPDRILTTEILTVRSQPSELDARGIYNLLSVGRIRYVTLQGLCEPFLLQSPWNEVDNGWKLRGL